MEAAARRKADVTRTSAQGGQVYQLQEVLGSGAFGRVWRATDEYGREFAVKFFSVGGPADREQLVLRHAGALIRVRHPGVVSIVAITRLEHPDSGQLELAIVMEFLRGVDLLHFRQDLTVERAKTMIEHLAGGLQAIHASGLVHDDIHSGNVMVTDSSAKLIDIPYLKTLAGVGSSTAHRTRVEDVRDFIRVVREILERVPGLSRSEIAACHHRAERSATSAIEVLAEFARVWPQRTAQERLRSLLSLASDIYLLVQRTDGGYRTHVIANRQTYASLWRFAVVVGGRLLVLRDAGRQIFIVRQDVADEWREGALELTPTHYERKILAAPTLESPDGTMSVAISTPDPENGAREEMGTWQRYVSIQGFVGDYAFVEQFDFRWAAGPHPDSARVGFVVHLPSGARHDTIFDEDELAELKRREGLVARESFLRLRDEDPLLEEMDVEVAAAFPVFEPGSSEATVRVVFTTFTSFVQSEPRWASYFLAEEVVTRRIPKRLRDVIALPEEVARALGDIPRVIGWSRVSPSDEGFDDLVALMAEDAPETVA
jgi:hypothetical protein